MATKTPNAKNRRQRCLICEREVKLTTVDGLTEFECEKCGRYRISKEAALSFEAALFANADLRHKASIKIRGIEIAMGGPVVIVGVRWVQTLFSTIDIALPDAGEGRVLTFLGRDETLENRQPLDLDCWSSIAGSSDELSCGILLNDMARRGLVKIVEHEGKVQLNRTPAGKKTAAKRLSRDVDKSVAEKSLFTLKSLVIEGVKCFGSPQSLSLTGKDGKRAKWTVLLGENGVGKTTVLQAIAALFPAHHPRSQDNERNGRDWISTAELLDRPVANDRLGRTPGLQTQLDLSGTFDSSEVAPSPWISSMVTIRSVDEVFSEMLMYGGSTSYSKSLRGNFAMGGLFHDSAVPPVVGYGAARLPAAIGTLSSKASDITGVENLFSPERLLRSPEDWLLTADYSARFDKRQWATQRLERVKKSLLKILPGITSIEFLPPSKERPEPSVEFTTAFGRQPLSLLSFGYQTTLAWVIDLAARLFDHYPESDDPLSEQVVVLVDEIDLHLHPKWQREIMCYLGEIFQSAQFIVTTHSPLVVQGIEDVNLAVLKRVGDEIHILNDVDEVRGWRADQILTSDLFDLESARPPYLEGLLDERRKLQTKSKLTQADAKRLERLNAQIGDLRTAETSDEAKAIEVIMKAAKRLQG